MDECENCGSPLGADEICMDCNWSDGPDLRSSNEHDPSIKSEICVIVANRCDGNLSDVQVYYEHGQWWAVMLSCYEDGERTFSVVDCQNRDSHNYIDIEEVL